MCIELIDSPLPLLTVHGLDESLLLPLIPERPLHRFGNLANTIFRSERSLEHDAGLEREVPFEKNERSLVGDGKRGCLGLGVAA